MGRVAIVLSFERGTEKDGTPRVDVKCDPGGGANITAEHFTAAGEDAPPLPGDAVSLGESNGSGLEVATGYQDPKNAGKAEPGEHRVYARNPDGTVMCEIHLKGAGAIELSNDKGHFKLGADGVADINGAKIDTQGNITTPGDVTAMSLAAPVKLSTHLHPTGMGPSGPPTPGS